ncbi:hypothetical protein RRG08_021782 [Elysia crispata]|uniref:Uncharacterized protein n=1 Tax=Elysia crispata TaxID=231223 RepID=A0AAE0ZZA5_9GAST|nr:hypothetical protein RRG08_021782 [Elysia crispata]
MMMKIIIITAATTSPTKNINKTNNPVHYVLLKAPARATRGQFRAAGAPQRYRRPYAHINSCWEKCKNNDVNSTQTLPLTWHLPHCLA